MKVIRIDEHGGPEVLLLREIELPEPGPGEARVGLHAAGLNFVDIYYRRGNIPAPLPFTLGSEGAGIVEAIGEGVEELKPGDRVAYTLHPGSYAEASIVPANLLIPCVVYFHCRGIVELVKQTLHPFWDNNFALGHAKSPLRLRRTTRGALSQIPRFGL
jgi:NADPH2:quinone reductase